MPRRTVWSVRWSEGQSGREILDSKPVGEHLGEIPLVSNVALFLSDNSATKTAVLILKVVDVSQAIIS